MATVTGTETAFRDDHQRHVTIANWAALTTTNDRGSKFESPQHADRSIHFTGTIGAAGHVKVEGHNGANPADNDTGWAVLDDTEGVAIDITTLPTIVNVGTISRWIRPIVTAGDGTTSIGAILLARRR